MRLSPKPRYLPVVPQKSDWPVVQLSKQRRAFADAVIDESVRTLLSTHSTARALQAMLAKTASLELARVRRSTWKVDLPDEVFFWEQISAGLDSQYSGTFPALLRKIISRYVHEMAFNFRISHYRLGTYVLGRLFNPTSLRVRRRNAWLEQAHPKHKIHITGAIEQLRKLTRLGTVVMVPTHSSHFDSIVLSWVTHTLGLPHFIYGAGLNLFNNRLFAYLMNRLGVYKIDRRRKNLPYLTTLKTYSTMALQWGCHSLFYPGGTRSRSGALDQELKLGLLGTALEAQRHNYQLQGESARKLFVVPVVLSYHCVPEAPLLIQGYLSSQGVTGLRPSLARRSSPKKLLRLADHIFKKEPSIFVSVGAAMDLLSNSVDEAGNSYDVQGRLVDPYPYFSVSKSETRSSHYEAQTKLLGKAIVKAYYQANYILASHLVAFTAFSLIRQQHAELSLKDLMQLAPEQLTIPYSQLEDSFARYREAILQLHLTDKVQIEPMLREKNGADIVQQGLRNLGLYHRRRPLLQNQAGDVTTQDLGTLFYYHNRLQGYDLDQYLS